jgi:hypothetical protein
MNRAFKTFLRTSGAYAVSSTTLNAETIAWQAAVISAGSTVSGASLTAHDNFISTLKTNGIRSAIKRLNTYGANTLAGSLIPIIWDVGTASDTNHNFVAGDFSLAAGLTGDGVTKYLDTGAGGNSFATPSSAHLGVVNGDVTTAAGPDIGYFTDSTHDFKLSAYRTSDNQGHFTSFATADQLNSTTTGNGGFVLGSRLSVNSASLYRNSVLKALNFITDGSSPAATNISVFTDLSNGFSAHTQQAYTLGLGLTGAQVTSFYNALNTLMSAIGRTIPV